MNATAQGVKPHDSLLPAKPGARLEGRDSAPTKTSQHVLEELNNTLSTGCNIFDLFDKPNPYRRQVYDKPGLDAVVQFKLFKKKEPMPSLELPPGPQLGGPNPLKARTKSTKDTLWGGRPSFASPEKVPAKYRRTRRLVRFARPIPKPGPEGEVADKSRIIQNLYFKNQAYFYSNRVDLRTLVRGIYFHGQQIDQLKDFLLPAFKKIQSNQSYFEAIFEEAKSFNEAVRSYASRKISKLLVLGDGDGEPPKGLAARGPAVNLRPFAAASASYIKIIELLHQNFKHLEQVNIEIEKLTNIYLRNYLNDGSQVEFDTYEFHARMFSTYVYNDRLVHEFVIAIYNSFKNCNFYLNRYQKISDKVFDIYENFERDHMPPPPVPKPAPQGLAPTQSAAQRARPGPLFPSRPDPRTAQADSPPEDEAGKKAKKKKKNKKKKGGKTKEDELAEESALKEDKPAVPLPPPINENAPLVLKGLEALEAVFRRVDRSFPISPQRRVAVRFEASELAYFVSLLAK